MNQSNHLVSAVNQFDHLYIFDKPVVFDIAQYVADRKFAHGRELKDTFLGHFSEATYKYMLIALCAAEVIKSENFVRVGERSYKQYFIQPGWKAKYDAAVKARKAQVESFSKKHQVLIQKKRDRSYPTDNWVKRWKPSRDEKVGWIFPAGKMAKTTCTYCNERNHYPAGCV